MIDAHQIHPHGLGVPGASAPPPPWVVILSALVARLRIGAARVDHDGRPAPRAARLGAAARHVEALLLLCGWRPLHVEAHAGDPLPLWRAAREDVVRVILQTAPGEITAAEIGAAAAMAAAVDDTLQWCSDG